MKDLEVMRAEGYQEGCVLTLTHFLSPSSLEHKLE